MAGATGDPGRPLGWNALKGLEESAPYCTAVRVVTGLDYLPAYQQPPHHSRICVYVRVLPAHPMLSEKRAPRPVSTPPKWGGG